MGSSRGPRVDRASLRVEYLEDRTTPSTLADLSLSDKVASGLVAPDRVIVVLGSGADPATLTASFVQQVRPLGNGIYGIRLTSGTDLGGALAYYGTLAGVASAEPDQILHADRVPNDALYGSLYGPAKIGAEAVWNTATGDPNFVVALIDSGLDYTHPDLAANVWVNPGEIRGNGIDDDGNGYVDDIHGWNFSADNNDPIDFDGHGTHVAGTIGAVGNNGIGVSGVNWSVKIMAVPFLGFGPNAGLLSSAIGALNYSMDMGAKVTNNSWGGYAGGSTAFGRTLARAQSMGQIFVCSAGNLGLDNDFQPGRHPSNLSASFDNVVAVAATDSNDQLADFSNFGFGTVNLAAPGVGVLSTWPTYIPSSTGQVGYEILDGTSMATPHVTGAIALYWSTYPTLSYSQVINRLKSTVDLVPGLTGKVSTGGRLNVARMLNGAAVPPVVVGAPVGTDVVRVLAPGGGTQLALAPHPGFLGGIEAAAGDVTGDGVAELVTAATFGGHVKVFDGATGAELRSFYGFEGYLGPISVAVGDITGDGRGEIIIAASLNGHVKVFDGLTGQPLFSEFVYQGYSGAIAVSAGDTNGDGLNELLTAADGGAGVHVKSFGAQTLALSDSFMATGPGSWPDFSLSAVDIDLDGIAELLVSQGPRVRVLNSQTKAVRADFLAFDPLLQIPITVQAGRYTGDPSAELVVIADTGGRAHVKVFDGPDFVMADSFYADTR